MPKFACDFQRTSSLTASVGTIGAVSTTQARRGKIFEINFSSESTPADVAILFTMQRYTAKGTVGAAVVPQPLDPADAAFLGEAGEGHTIEPTYTAAQILGNFSVNQRATFRWVAVPGCEWVWPATTANGIGVQTDTIAGGTPLVTVQTYVEE